MAGEATDDTVNDDTLQRAQATEWGLVFAAALIALVPVLCLLVVLQKQFISGAFVGATREPCPRSSASSSSASSSVRSARAS